MKGMAVSKVVCIADRRLTGLVEEELRRMGLSDFYAEHGKQVSLKTHRGLLGQRTRLMEAPADITRFYVPRGREAEAMVRLAAATDLFLPGRGSLFSEPVMLWQPGGHAFDPDRLDLTPPAWAHNVPLKPSPHDMIWCVVQRGRGNELAQTLLEMGLCVPTISYGEGMGLRDRLGLLRITIPRDKEILLSVVLAADSDFVMDVMLRKARLREPGRGYLCRSRVSALLTNTRMYQDPRRHVASMEQIISTLDLLRGSTDWRRLPYAGGGAPSAISPHARRLVRFCLICEEGDSGRPISAVLNAGAGGATQTRLLRQSTTSEEGETATSSHARERCDLVVPRALVRRLENALDESGFFAEPSRGMAEVASVIDAVSYATK